MKSKVVLLVVAAGLLALGGWLFVATPAPSKTPPPAPTGGQSPPAPPAAAPDPAVVARREAARKKLAEMQVALDKVMPARRVVASGPERRPGESQQFYEERQRAIADWNVFINNAHLQPEQVDVVARVIADAQDTWKNGLAAAHRTQPTAVGAEMSDPVLSQLLLSLTEEAQRAAREAVPGPTAAILQSYLPSMLPYVRTRVFEPPR